MRGPNWKFLCGVVGLVIGFGVVGFAEEPLVTDRPDFTQSSSAVGRAFFHDDSSFRSTGSTMVWYMDCFLMP